MKKQLLLLLLLQANLFFLVAQKIVPATNPEAAGFSSSRLQRITKAMDEWWCSDHYPQW